MKTEQDIKDALEKAWQEYTEKVLNIAEEARNQHLVPLLDKHNLAFVSGNGSWYIHDLKKVKSNKNQWENVLK
jgi:hypothetical protein